MQIDLIQMHSERSVKEEQIALVACKIYKSEMIRLCLKSKNQNTFFFISFDSYFLQLMSKQVLKRVLSNVLESIKQTQDFAKEAQMIDDLINHLMNEQTKHLIEFVKYLEEQFDLKPKATLILAQKLMKQPEFIKAFGIKITNFWLLFKIYEVFDIRKGNNQDKQKRKKVQQTFTSYKYTGSNIPNLLKACCLAANLPTDDIQEFSGMITEDKKNQKLIIQLFKQQVIVQQLGYNPDKSIQEQLKDFIEDYKIMPDDSIEKDLQRQIILAHVQKNKSGNNIIDQLLPSLNQKSEIQLFKRKCSIQNPTLSSEIEQKFKKAKNPDEIYNELCALKSKILPINVLELQRLINKTNDAKQLIEGKNVVFIIGNTGSGKSTNILKFLGYDLQQGKYGKMTTLVPIGNLDQLHKTFYTSPEDKSCTRYINAVPFPEKMYPKNILKAKMNLVICDSPGFGDSAGVEVDIANGVGMIKALYGAQSVRVVVILPYQSLIADRLKGAVEISQIISNLFTEMTALNSVAIYFNKVPLEKVAQIPVKISYKMKNLNQTLKTNQKLVIFLKEILERSQDQENFIYPLSSNYKQLFQKITRMPAINDVSYSFKYEFTESTKKDIQKFILSERMKVQDFFKEGKYKIAKFHLSLLQKLMNILIHNDKVRNNYKQLAQFIQDCSERQINYYSDLVSQIANGLNISNNIQSKMNQSKAKIIELQELFQDFADLNIVSASKINTVVQDCKLRLLSAFNNIQDISNQNIVAVKNFSTIIHPKIEGEVLKKIDIYFGDVMKQAENQLTTKKCSQMSDNIKILVKLASYSSQLTQKSSSNLNSISFNSNSHRLNQLKNNLNQLVSNYFEDIEERIIKNEKITEKQVKNINQRIDQIRAIQELKFLDNNLEVRNKLTAKLKRVEGKCKSIIRELQDLKLILLDTGAAQKMIDKTELANKKRQIELLMKVSNLKENLEDDYLYAIKTVTQSLKENEAILKNSIDDLKSNKKDEIYKNLENIKKATMIVIQCSQLVENSEESLEFAKSIEFQFVQYLRGVIMGLRSTQFKLNQLKPQTFQNIKEHSLKIQSYAKMSIIGGQIKQTVQQLKIELLQRLQGPFDEFLEKQIPYLQENKEYKFLSYSIDKLDKFGTYALGLEDIINYDQYKKISASEDRIINCLANFQKQMAAQIEDFHNLQIQIGNFPVYLKQLLKTLLAIKQKFKACEYFCRKLSFVISQKLQNIQIRLGDIKEILTTAFKESNGSAQKLQIMSADCKFYSQIEDIYKTRGEKLTFGFRELQIAINSELSKCLNNDCDRIKTITNKKPTQISFSQLQTFYKKFLDMNSLQGIKNRNFMVTQLQRVERETIKQLDNFRRQMQDLAFVRNPARIDDFLAALSEAVEIQKQLKKLYADVQEDRKQIQTKQTNIQKIGFKVINAYESQFQILKDMLDRYDLTAIDQKFKTFGSLQSIIYDLFELEKNEQQNQKQKAKDIYGEDLKPQDHSKKGEARLNKFINISAAALREMIAKFQLAKDAQIKAKSTRRLKNLLDIVRSCLDQQIKIKYGNNQSHFSIDENFVKFYSYSEGEKLQQLKTNVGQYFQNMQKEFRQAFNSSTDAAQNIKKTIEEKIKHLPGGLKTKHMKIFQELKIGLVRQNDELIQRMSLCIIQKPNNVANFFAHSKKAKANKQDQLHEKWVKKLQQKYQQFQQKDTTLDEKMAFIENNLIGVYEQNKEYLKFDIEMFQVLSKRYNSCLKNLQRIGQESISSLISYFNSTRSSDQNKPNPQLKTIVIFKVYNFITLRQHEFIKDGNFRQNFIQLYANKLRVLINCYSNILSDKPEEMIDSKDILQPIKMKKLQTYIQNVSYAGQVTDLIKNSLDNTKSIVKRSQIDCKPLLKQIFSIEPYSPILESYQNQFATMKGFVTKYEFFTDIKRNHNTKEIEDDLNELDRFYEILQARKDFFMKYIIKRQMNFYDFQHIANGLLNKFNAYVSQGQKQVNQTFRNINGEQAPKINLLIQQLEILINRKELKFISFEAVKTAYNKISNLIKVQFVQAFQKCNTKLQIAKIKYQNISKEVQIQQTDKRNQVQNQTDQCRRKVGTKQAELTKICQDRVNQQKDESKKKEYRESMRTELNSIKNELTSYKDKNIKQIQAKYDAKIKESYGKLNLPVKQFAQSLIIYQKGLLDIYLAAQNHKKYMELILQLVHKIGPKFIKLLQTSLLVNSQDFRSIGKQILTNNRIFNYALTLRKQLIKGQDIRYALQNLETINPSGRGIVPAFEMKSIDSLYKVFKEKYDVNKEKFKTNPTVTTINYMITEIKKVGNLLMNDFYQSKYPSKQTNDKIELLAGIFALWAIIKAETNDNEVQYTMQPHPTQITTLLLLLGISREDQNITNRLAQVGTGEGKSIVLAGLCSYLALVGYKVRCACYSSYLSVRDQQSFNDLFEKLGLQKDIKYGTFNQLCQDILNGGGANFKNEVQNMLLQPPAGFKQKFTNFWGLNTIGLNRNANEITKNPTILVIDEIDVFFDNNFFGNTYCPAISLRGPQVSQFLQSVWEKIQKKGKDIEIDKLIASQHFTKLVNRYPSLKDLLQNQVHGMVAGALNYKHDYLIFDQRIAYKDNDSLSFTINYGYKTVFAYFYEFQQNRVTRPYLDRALQISLMAAEFSYAILPNYFRNILGVTGTLQVLPVSKKSYLSNYYRINDQYAIPSAFGINKNRTQEYTLTSMETHYSKIVEKINNVKDNRPIIIFFKGSRQLNQFCNSPLYQSFLKRTCNLTEEHDASTRDKRIIDAVNPGRITLMSGSFGRGTDFVIFDDNIKEKGGLHIIQAFLSLDESEQVQIKGRTARQNGKGSYDCVLDVNWLEELSLVPTKIPKEASSEDIHQILLRARQEKAQNQSQTTVAKLNEANKKHQEVWKIFSMQQLAQKDLINYVLSLNFYPLITKTTIKTVLGLDATGSMKSALQKTAQIIATAFERTYNVLNDQKEKANVEIKIMIYRNYNSPSEQIINGTAFESKPDNLTKFLKGLRTKGGLGNEAIQVLFQALNREEQLDQVILIGDAPPNQVSEITQRRKNHYGENYWNNKNFPITSIKKEIELLNKSKRCKVHSFYLNNGEGFKSISDMTKGTASKFELNSPQVTQKLTKFVVENILASIGEKKGKGSFNLVQSYRRMFPG